MNYPATCASDGSTANADFSAFVGKGWKGGTLFPKVSTLPEVFWRFEVE
ncbi:hypothetical protein CLOSTMETH_00029 [[Clostridium] methylpentosum DSM 5476]|uniref:Uncharacterized protein n=1 Tax=[Clostridium] methylpentosum DSM 5476 TaxID=537013 RepID=C0E8C6_9FIRM|nr:hypothetical protein CLOSTMETH_00029 [[Clostridium] methylpentosum DSM 5476]